MPANKKIFLRRMKSVRNTRKITKAMEMVATAKMRKATERALAGRPYIQSLTDLFFHVHDLVAESELSSWVSPRPEAPRVLLLLFMSDRGLCGGYNGQMIKAVRGWLASQDVAQVDVVAIGKRAALAARRLNLNIVASFAELATVQGPEAMRAPMRVALDGFTAGAYRQVVVAYTDFKSRLSQVPVCTPLLPLSVDQLTPWRREAETSEVVADTLLEPSALTIFERVVPPLVRALGWQALLEAQASEHAARMMAMRNATDAASDVLTGLTRLYNQARQASITQEIAEISGGKAALESA